MHVERMVLRTSAVLLVLLAVLQGSYAQLNDNSSTPIVTTTEPSPPPTDSPATTQPVTSAPPRPSPTTSSVAPPTPHPTVSPQTPPPPVTTTHINPTTTLPSTTAPPPVTPTPSPTTLTPSTTDNTATLAPIPTITSPEVFTIEPPLDDTVPDATPGSGGKQRSRTPSPTENTTSDETSESSNAVGVVATIGAIFAGIGLAVGAVWLVRRRRMEELADDDDEVELDDFIPPKVERKQSQQTHQTRPSSWSSNDDGIRHSANPAVGHVQDDPHSIALDVDDSVFFTWRSPSQKNQPPVFTQLVVTSEQDDDDTAPMFMRSPSDQMMLHSDVPDIFLTGESSSSFSSYQYTQRENGVPNQDGSKPVPCFDAADSSDIHSHASVSYSSTPCHHRSSYNDDGDSYAEGDDDDNRSFMSAASSNVSGLYIQSESDYSPRSSQQSSDMPTPVHRRTTKYDQ